ncbi:hypothetical protein [Streptomyces harbinensis]|uniref:hypothetical protein n=1 Tax=Streptomyces harbinensis TaxID=1176198 RepID=UPI0034DE8D04
MEAAPRRAHVRVPDPEVTVYPPGRQPLLRVSWEGTQPLCPVMARQDWADGRVAYQVVVPTSFGRGAIRLLWWDPRRIRAGCARSPPRRDSHRAVHSADQIQRLAAPHLTVRHAGKPTAAARKEARTRAHRAAAQDLKKHRLVVEAGHARAGSGCGR